jgi:DNA-directed RNA polymerase subunit H (RpoH/RPB5)
MEQNKEIFYVYKSEKEKTDIIIKNVLIMLSNRIYINERGEKHSLLSLNEAPKKLEDKGNNTYVIRTDNGDDYAIKIMFQTITTIGKQSVISDFLGEYASYHKIIIARDFSNKIAEFITHHHAHTQIFKESALLENIIDYYDQPKFEILSPSEKQRFLNEYNVTKYSAKKMNKNDPIARYYALKKGDVVRIIRSSPVSGESIDYRMVN